MSLECLAIRWHKSSCNPVFRRGWHTSDPTDSRARSRLVSTGTVFSLCFVRLHAPKVSALKTNPKVAFTVDTNAFPPHVLLVRGTAAIDIVDGVPPEYLAASRKGVGPDQWDAFEAQVRAMYKQMARIKITPLWAKLLDFQTRFPTPIEKLIRRASSRTGAAPASRTLVDSFRGSILEQTVQAIKQCHEPRTWWWVRDALTARGNPHIPNIRRRVRTHKG